MIPPSTNLELVEVNDPDPGYNVDMTFITFDTARDEAHEAEDQQVLICPECSSGHTRVWISEYSCDDCGSIWTRLRKKVFRG